MITLGAAAALGEAHSMQAALDQIDVDDRLDAVIARYEQSGAMSPDEAERARRYWESIRPLHDPEHEQSAIAKSVNLDG